MNQARIKSNLDALAEQDRDLRRGLDQVGYPLPRIRDPGFETLLSTIVSQQISTDAAAAIMRRVRALLPEMQPRKVLRLPDGALRQAGLSQRKVDYVESLARALEMSGVPILKDGADKGRVIWATGWQGLLDLGRTLDRDIGTGIKGQAAVLRHDAAQ